MNKFKLALIRDIIIIIMDKFNFADNCTNYQEFINIIIKVLKIALIKYFEMGFVIIMVIILKIDYSSVKVSYIILEYCFIISYWIAKEDSINIIMFRQMDC